jgi:hypothetical protein
MRLVIIPSQSESIAHGRISNAAEIWSFGIKWCSMYSSTGIHSTKSIASGRLIVMSAVSRISDAARSSSSDIYLPTNRSVALAKPNSPIRARDVLANIRDHNPN